MTGDAEGGFGIIAGEGAIAGEGTEDTSPLRGVPREARAAPGADAVVDLLWAPRPSSG